MTPDSNLFDRSKRDLLKQLGGGIALASVGASGLLWPRFSRAYGGFGPTRPSIGIIGGGIGGISTAWLLDGEADVVLFEAYHSLGGHATTVNVDYKGHPIAVDVGAQYFAPKPYPAYTKMVELLGLLCPEAPETDQVIPACASLTVFERGARRPRFLSPQSPGRIWPIFAPWNMRGLKAFKTSVEHAAAFENSGDWNMTLGEWIERLPLPKKLKQQIIYPYLTSVSGCSIEDGNSLSARAVLFYVTSALNNQVIKTPLYYNSLIGLQGIVETLAANCTTLTAHTGAAATRIEKVGAQYRITASNGVSAWVDHVVMASPPSVSRELLAPLAGHDTLDSTLARFRSFPTRIVIHGDPVYMPKKRRMWSAVNTEINDVQCESSMWLGAMHRTPDGGTVDLFKSWATVRDRQPSELIHERNFRHLLPTPDMLAAQKVLADRQGAENIWFAGAYMGPYVNQENALQSAIGIAQNLAPRSAHLMALLAGLKTETRHPELEQDEIILPGSRPLKNSVPSEALQTPLDA